MVTSENHTNRSPPACHRSERPREPVVAAKMRVTGDAGERIKYGQREIRIMNMRNLDNQMMLYFSDKSLTFKLYYYILL